MSKADEIYLPSALFGYKYDVFSTMKEMKRAYYYEERDKFLKRITSRARKRKRK